MIRVTEKLANTERHLDISKNHALRAEDNTDELKKLNKSIFRPAITFNKDAKRAAKEAKIQARYDEDREERERTLMDVRESQNNLGRVGDYGRDGEGVGSGRQLTGAQQAMRKEQRSRFQFEATGSDDEIEDELDGNLDEIADATKRLKALGMSMGQELGTQNARIDRISEKATGLDNRMFRNTEKVTFFSPPLRCLSLLLTPSCSSSASSNPSNRRVRWIYHVLEGLFNIMHHGLATKDLIPTVCFIFVYNERLHFHV